MRYEWLASGGAYWILGAAWLVGAALYVVFAMRLGAARRQEADGCVLALGCLVTMSVGGGVGLQAAPYPWSILAALSLGLVCPGVLVAFWLRKR